MINMIQSFFEKENNQIKRPDQENQTATQKALAFLAQENPYAEEEQFVSSTFSQPTRLLKGWNQKYVKSSYADGKTYTSFSGADAVVSVVFKGGKPVVIGECQTLTYSLYRPTNPVYQLGSAKPAGFVRGPRTIAGSIIFTVFDRHVLVSALHKSFEGSQSPCLDYGILPDEMPAFDFHITFLNEYGQSARILIYGVRLLTEGQVMSIEDMITENTAQFMASDIQVMEPNVADEIY